MADLIDSSAGLDALAVGRRVIDRHGDSWTRVADGWTFDSAIGSGKVRTSDHILTRFGPAFRLISVDPMTGPIAPDALREALVATIGTATAGHPYTVMDGDGSHAMCAGCGEAHDVGHNRHAAERITDAVLDVVAKHRDQEPG